MNYTEGCKLKVVQVLGNKSVPIGTIWYKLENLVLVGNNF